METPEPIAIPVNKTQYAEVWRHDRTNDGEACIGITLPDDEKWGAYAEMTEFGEVIRLPTLLAKEIARAILA